jgi:hypothetical protein
MGKHLIFVTSVPAVLAKTLNSAGVNVAEPTGLTKGKAANNRRSLKSAFNPKSTRNLPLKLAVNGRQPDWAVCLNTHPLLKVWSIATIVPDDILNMSEAPDTVPRERMYSKGSMQLAEMLAVKAVSTESVAKLYTGSTGEYTVFGIVVDFSDWGLDNRTL